MRYQVISNVQGDRQEVERFGHLPNAKDLALSAADRTPFGVAFEVIDTVAEKRIGFAERPRSGEAAVWKDSHGK